MSRAIEVIDTWWDGTQELAHFDCDGNLIGIQFHNPDVESVLESNKTQQTEGNEGYGETRELRHVGRVPVSVIMQYAQDHGIPLEYACGGPGQMEVIKRILSDSDYAHLRTVSNVSF